MYEKFSVVRRPTARVPRWRRAWRVRAQFISWTALVPAVLLAHRGALAQDCGCDIVVSPSTTFIDGNVTPHAPGDVICLMAGVKQSLRIFNFQGSLSDYLIIKNCSGQVVLTNSTGNYGINVQNSRYFRLTGTGDPAFDYGFKVSQSGSMGVTLGGYSTDYEVDHIEIANVGFAGIMSKTEPTCANPDLRSFVQRNTYFHHNYIYNTGGEGFYVGYSAYPSKSTTCNGAPATFYPHTLEGVGIYSNILENLGWDGIQMGSATAAASIHSNTIENFGTTNTAGQTNGIQLGAGTAADVYDNWISNGTGNGIAVFGTGGNWLYNNVILNPDESGIFCDDRWTTPGAGFHFAYNTIVGPLKNGIRMYSDESTGNTFYNNVIADPGQPCVYLLNSNIDWSECGTLCAPTVGDVGFVDPLAGDYHLQPSSPACGAGCDVPGPVIEHDHDGVQRASPPDIGAYECADSGVVFSQDFNSCSSVSCYVSSVPDAGQLDDISSEATGGTWSINAAGQLELSKAGSSTTDNDAGITRHTDFAGPPSVLHVTFKLGLANFNSFQNDSFTFDIGKVDLVTDYGNGLPSIGTFARLNIDGGGANTFKLEIGGVQSSSLATGANMYSISYLLNKSGVTQSYKGPDNTTRTLNHARVALWVGGTLVFDNIAAMNGAQSTLADLRMRFPQSDSGKWRLDDIVILDELPQ